MKRWIVRPTEWQYDLMCEPPIYYHRTLIGACIDYIRRNVYSDAANTGIRWTIHRRPL